jgi:threonine dehydrogenase-like Zn-dependent dehydrogenase
MILSLKARGVGPVIASDFSAGRRALAEKMGADVVVDPAVNSPYKSWLEVGAPADFDASGPLAILGIDTRARPCVIFECVGVPGLIQQVMLNAPPRSRIVVVGVCMESDSFEPIVGIGKELDLSFAFAYSGEEFSQTLYDLADGKLDAAAMITSVVAPEGVADAFDTLATPEHEAKIMISFE